MTGLYIVGAYTGIGLLLLAGLHYAIKRDTERCDQERAWRESERRCERRSREITRAFRGAYVEPVHRKPQGLRVYGNDESEIVEHLLESIQ